MISLAGNQTEARQKYKQGAEVWVKREKNVEELKGVRKKVKVTYKMNACQGN